MKINIVRRDANGNYIVFEPFQVSIDLIYEETSPPENLLNDFLDSDHLDEDFF